MPELEKRNWWQRNWKWFVPTGCLTLAALAAAFVACAVIFVFTLMKSSDAYQIALARAKADRRVTEAIGMPINDSWFVSGSTNVTGGSGTADLSIPIHGPKGAATIYCTATKSAGQWQYSQLVVSITNSKQRIDLLQPHQP